MRVVPTTMDSQHSTCSPIGDYNVPFLDTTDLLEAGTNLSASDYYGYHQGATCVISEESGTAIYDDLGYGSEFVDVFGEEEGERGTGDNVRVEDTSTRSGENALYSQQFTPPTIIDQSTSTTNEPTLTLDHSIEHEATDQISDVDSTQTCSPQPEVVPEQLDAKNEQMTGGQEAMVATATSGKRSVRRKVPCPTCGKSYRKFYLAVHIRTHTSEKPFACPEPDCRRQFSAACYLQLHVRRCHQRTTVATAADTFTCGTCRRVLASKASLREHARTLHGGGSGNGDHPYQQQRNFRCRTCSASFRQAALLASHERSHEAGDGDFTCERCGNRYKYKRSLERHIERIHEGVVESFACDRCDRSFSTRSKLREHGVYVHDGNSPHVCPLCNKRLLARKTLQNHMLIHGDLKPFVCPFCQRRFRFSIVLQRHLATHTKTHPFRCEACGKGFIHNVYRQRHVTKCPALLVKRSEEEEEEMKVVVAEEAGQATSGLSGGGRAASEDMRPISLAVASMGLVDVEQALPQVVNILCVSEPSLEPLSTVPFFVFDR